jgi:hypothetical protein
MKINVNILFNGDDYMLKDPSLIGKEMFIMQRIKILKNSS